MARRTNPSPSTTRESRALYKRHDKKGRLNHEDNDNEYGHEDFRKDDMAAGAGPGWVPAAGYPGGLSLEQCLRHSDGPLRGGAHLVRSGHRPDGHDRLSGGRVHQGPG